MLKAMLRDTLFSYLRGRGYEVHAISPSQRLNKRRLYKAEHEARLRFEALDSEIQMAQPFTNFHDARSRSWNALAADRRRSHQR
jgi:hypothetical protein